MNLSCPDWVVELQAALAREFTASATFAMLATCDASHQPHARVVVIREIEADGTMWFCTDARSEKVGQMAQNRAAEVLFWLASLRVQYRIQAQSARVVENESRQKIWNMLRDPAKTTFNWPMPGEARDEAAIERASLPEVMPATFAVYRLVPEQVEYLSVAQPSHPRWIARQGDGWVRHAVNP